MTHLPFIAAAYSLTLALSAWLGIGAMLRLSRARRRLEAFETQAVADGRRGRRT
jgi:hypothetical protein